LRSGASTSTTGTIRTATLTLRSISGAAAGRSTDATVMAVSFLRDGSLERRKPTPCEERSTLRAMKAVCFASAACTAVSLAPLLAICVLSWLLASS
jgi:hypothetical protein